MNQKYIQFINDLQLCKLLHFVIYRKNKISNMSFDELLKMQINLPNYKKIILENDIDKYTAYKNNVHHWTTSYVWNSFIPVLLNQLNLKIDEKQFVKIPYIWNTCDFSYHNKIDAKFKILQFEKNKEEIGNHEILRNTNNCPFMVISCYHSLFKLSHESGMITNLNDAPINKIAINCDSMAIPVLPILACFCKQMLVIDNRTSKNKNYMKLIIDFKPQYYISLFTEENFLFQHKYIKNIE